MKTITKEYNLYTFDELSQEAKDKARNKFNEFEDYPFLQDDLRENIYEELKERGIKVLGVATSANPSIRPLYSLGYSQGDGLMFEGDFEWNGYNVNVKHSGHYYHENSKVITITDEEGNEPETNEPEEAFNAIYKEVCKIVRDIGYSQIEYNQSEECFAETCEANEYNFLSDGTMFNN